MKKLLLTLLIIFGIVALTACGGDGGNTGDTESLSFINGVNLSEYAIVYPEGDGDYNKRAAEYIKDEILARTGLELAVVTDGESTAENEIVVGETKREISGKLDAETEGLEFAIMADGTSVALEGDYFIIAAAAYYFIETYVPSDDFNATVPEEVCVREPIVKEAKNFILLIGDGMGVYQTRLFEQLEDKSDYSDGEDIFYGYMLPYSGFSRTDSLSGVTDSAAGGTALSCGTKTLNGHIGQDKDFNNLLSLTELAGSLGKSTAVMSTESARGATPATFSAHANDRSDSAEIFADQAALTLKYGTIVECGYDYYTAQYMKSIERRITDTLGKLDDDEDGFFMMYEEAHIDKHSHDNDIEKTFLALIRFNQAIARFMEFAFYNPDTFILITADHETGALTPNEDGVFTYGSESHSSADVPIFAYGDGAELFNGKTVENIQIAHTIASFFGVTDFGDQSVYQYLK